MGLGNSDQENFILDYFSKDWNNDIKEEHANVNLSFENFLHKITYILNKYSPIKKVSKQKLKFKSKPWITPGVQKSILVKNELLSKFIRLVDSS